MRLPTPDPITSAYQRDGFFFPVDAMLGNQARAYRKELEEIEGRAAREPERYNTAIWFTNANFVLPFVDEITRLPTILDPVKSILGPNILVWNASFFIKEPRTPDFVSWHQDLKYWGLTGAEEVTAWVALSRADVQSGCMRFVAGSHEAALLDHRDTFADENLLSRGQELAIDVDESKTVNVVLNPGQMSLHHGHTFHASHPNQSDDRRIGLTIRYITAEMAQRDGIRPYAHLVAGEDRCGNFQLLSGPTEMMTPRDVDLAVENITMVEKFFYEDTAMSGKTLR